MNIPPAEDPFLEMENWAHRSYFLVIHS
jgi:hypothetical protein